MKIAILMLNIEKIDANQYYNSQAEGMAKAFSSLGHEVLVYHMIPGLDEPTIHKSMETIEVEYIRSRHIGKHAIVPLRFIHTDYDYLIVCSDNYIDFRRVYHWSIRHKIGCIPYIGVLRSNNSSKWKKMVADFISDNTKYYVKIPVAVKTPELKMALEKRGAQNVTVITPALDTTLLNDRYTDADRNELRCGLNVESSSKLILFIGRMTQEKQPLLMIQIFNRLYREDDGYRLIMLGDGELKCEAEQLCDQYGLTSVIQFIPQMNNTDIWKLYRSADFFINLNDHEIFGMAILEAMYYECCVIALHAPGPDCIIKDKLSGYLCRDEDDIINTIQNERTENIDEKAHQRIMSEFIWTKVVEDFIIIMERIREND